MRLRFFFFFFFFFDDILCFVHTHRAALTHWTRLTILTILTTNIQRLRIRRRP